MNGHPEYQKLVELFQRVNSLNHAVTMLSWDQMVMMPDGGASSRSETIAELSVMRHELLSSESVRDSINNCENNAQSLTDAEMRSVAEIKNTYLDVSCLPTELVKKQVLAGSKCEHGWRTQRSENDWSGFLSNFKEVVALSREEAAVRQQASGAKTPYDSLLDLHCRGDSSDLIDQVFGQLKAELPELIQTVVDKQRERESGVTNSQTHDNRYPVDEQISLSHALMGSLGFDFSAGRLDVSAHPFSTGVRGDQRITTRYDERTFLDALLATAHETGHASYEAGLPEEWAGLPVGESRNMCIHESQSLMFEKMLTLSDPFLKHMHSLIVQHFSSSVAPSVEQLKSLARTVSKSYIRVEADEMTYPIHVALRYDIERDLINCKLEPEHIPEAWDAAMQAGLGLSTKDNYKEGCLQDIHWSDGTFGYFPSYTMGAVNSAQLFSAMTEQHSDWAEKLEQGDIRFARDWLSENIWMHGCHLSSQELMLQATGDRTNASSLLNHLKARYLSH